MSYIINIFNYVRLTIMIKHYCKKYRISEDEAKKIASKKLADRKKKRAAKEILKLILRRKIAVISCVIALVCGLLCTFIYYGVQTTSKEQMAAIASYNLAMAETAVEGEYIIFSGEAICDLYGQGGIAISADVLNKYNVQCNGKYALKIKYKAYEIYGLTKDEDKKTIIANEEGDRSYSLNSTEAVEDSTEVQQSKINGLGGFKSDITKFSNCLSSCYLSLTTEEKVYELVFHSGDEGVLDSGTYLTGYNWKISQVDVVDIEKRRQWELENGYIEDGNGNIIPGGSGTGSGVVADGTLNPQSRKLKNWYKYISDIQAACDVVDSNSCKPYSLIGTMLREANGSLTSDLNSDTWSYETDLASINSGDKASGVVTQEHNNGWGQFDKTLWNGNRMKFGSTNAGEALALDSSLGIYRPNCWYGSDQVWTSEIFNALYIINTPQWSQLQSSTQLSSLDPIDRSFILGFLVEVLHNRGSGKIAEEVSSAETLINIAVNKQSYGMSYIYDMADTAGVTTWDEGRQAYYGSNIATSDISPDKVKYDAKFSLNWHSSSGGFPYQEYAYLNALCGGYKCYNQMMGLITADSPTQPSTGGGTGGDTGSGGCAITPPVSGTGGVVTWAAQTVYDTWHAEGLNQYIYGGTFDSPTYGRIRPDCSGFVSCVLWQAGYTDHYRAIRSTDYYNNTIGWQVVGYGKSTPLEPGDIWACDGHVQIFAGYGASGERLWYNWGSNDGVKQPAPSTGGDFNFNRTNNFVILRAPN